MRSSQLWGRQQCRHRLVELRRPGRRNSERRALARHAPFAAATRGPVPKGRGKDRRPARPPTRPSAARRPRAHTNHGHTGSDTTSSRGCAARGSPSSDPLPLPHRERCAASCSVVNGALHGGRPPRTRRPPSATAAANANDDRPGTARSECVRRPRPRRWRPSRPCLRRRRHTSSPCPRYPGRGRARGFPKPGTNRRRGFGGGGDARTARRQPPRGGCPLAATPQGGHS